jgi:predicted ATP-grasp superfamily ATP-dependent carboligase
VKIDFSSGGNGVFEVATAQALAAIPVERYPVLLQEKIDGNNLEFSVFFQKGMPVFYDIAEPLCCRPNRFGPGVLRKYRMPTQSNRVIFEHLKSLGAALGADGFANVCCIESRIDGQYYFIEADMRPTVWVEYSKYFDEDPANKISRYFHGDERSATNGYSVETKTEVVLSYAPRLSFFEILFNRYHCRAHYSNYLRRKYLFSSSSIKSTKFWLLDQIRHWPLVERLRSPRRG